MLPTRPDTTTTTGSPNPRRIRFGRRSLRSRASDQVEPSSSSSGGFSSTALSHVFTFFTAALLGLGAGIFITSHKSVFFSSSTDASFLSDKSLTIEVHNTPTPTTLTQLLPSFTQTPSPSISLSPTPSPSFSQKNPLSSCVVVAPLLDAAVRWPQTLIGSVLSSTLPTTAIGAEVSTYWSVSVCTGGTYAPSLPTSKILPQTTQSHCSPSSSCEGAIVVRRLKGCPASARCGIDALAPPDRLAACAAEPADVLNVLDWNSSFGLADLRALGPDDFLVALEGAEFVAPQQVHSGGCEYIFPFHITIPGTYRLLAQLTRSDWRSANESVAGYPQLTRDDLLGTRALIEIGGGVTNVITEVARETVLMGNALKSSVTPLLLPVCTEPLPAGRYVRTVTTLDMFALPQPWFRTHWWIDRDEPNGLGIRYYTEMTTDLVYTPYACRVRPLSLTGVRTFLSDKRMNWRGDSQLRTVYNHFMRVFCGNPEAASKLQTLTEDLVVSAVPDCPGLTSSFSADRTGDQPVAFGPVEALPNHLTVVNFGQHYAAGSRRATLKDYSAGLQRYWTGVEDQVTKYGKGDIRLLWIDTFPMCVRNDDFVHGYADWRTPHRIQLYNAASARTVSEFLGKRIIDVDLNVHAMLRQVVDICPDGAHFIDVFYVLDYVTRAILTGLGGDAVLEP